jgi:hypothetical protein
MSRAGPWVSSSDHEINARIRRALCQRLYLIDRPTKDLFIVQGSTVRFYKVLISKKPTCTCPDFNIRRNICKHIIFVYCKVFKLSIHSPLIYQRNLLQEEVDNILSNEIVFNNNDTKRKKNDECVICFEKFDKKEKVVWCRATCGNNFHYKCFQKWSAQKQNVTCPMCRSIWI